MRRLLAMCAVTLGLCAVFAAARKHPGVTAMAAGAGRDSVTVADPPGCPLGPVFTFCAQVPGLTSNAQGFQTTLAHPTNGLTFSFGAIPGYMPNFAAGDFSIQSTTCNTMLKAGDTCDFVILFAPTTTITASMRMADLTITNPNEDVTVFPVEGGGSAIAFQLPALPACSPAVAADNSYTYCDEPVGGTSATESFTLTAGSAVTGLNITFAAVPGLESEFSAGDFTFESNGCGGTLLGGNSCALGVAFTPTTADLRAAQLTATDDAGDSTIVSLAGHTTTGLTITPGAPAAGNCFGGAGYQFCTEPTAGTAKSKTLILTNTSGTMVSGLAFPAVTNPPTAVDFALESNSCLTTLAAGANCSFAIAFTPRAAGLRQAPFIVTDAQGDAATANFAGVGDDYTVVPIQPAEITVPQGGTATFKAQATPDAVFGVNGEQIVPACPANLPSFSTCAFNPCPVVITPGMVAPFSIVIVTSSAKVSAPRVNPCSGLASGNAAPNAPSGPNLVLHVAPRARSWPVPLFLPLALLAIFGAAMAAGGVRAFPKRARTIALLILATAGVTASALIGCGGGNGTAPGLSPTPTGSTLMTIPVNATDSGGNPISASRGMQITLDVVSP
ncbi:MAG TPA: choice-of-anchor D domain-containing protein [Candidatus Acidoferrales bacterium]|nr:choice-of-anchor D domain-containing protein [Candidatus Acidoferrales bacterium]